MVPFEEGVEGQKYKGVKPLDEKNLDRTRMHVFFSGRVQGVGFRYTVASLAPQFEAVGWVRNLPDGRVELVVEGERAKLEQLNNRIREVMGSFLREVNVSWSKCTGAWQNFSIKH